jgi:hypothetical protein
MQIARAFRTVCLPAFMWACLGLLASGCSKKPEAAPAAPPAPSNAPRFEIASDGQSVTDRRNRLVWKRCVEGRRFMMNACLGDTRRVESNVLEHFVTQEALPEGWRLPTANELFTIIETTYEGPDLKVAYVVDMDVFPEPVLEENLYYWVGGRNGEVGSGVMGFYNYDGRLLSHTRHHEGSALIRLVKKAP